MNRSNLSASLHAAFRAFIDGDDERRAFAPESRLSVSHPIPADLITRIGVRQNPQAASLLPTPFRSFADDLLELETGRSRRWAFRQQSAPLSVIAGTELVTC